MARFIEFGGRVVNVDHIVQVWQGGVRVAMELAGGSSPLNDMVDFGVLKAALGAQTPAQMAKPIELMQGEVLMRAEPKVDPELLKVLGEIRDQLANTPVAAKPAKK